MENKRHVQTAFIFQGPGRRSEFGPVSSRLPNHVIFTPKGWEG